MRLRDVAGAADDGGITALLKLAGLGAVGDDVGGVVAGQAARSRRFGGAIGFGSQERGSASVGLGPR